MPTLGLILLAGAAAVLAYADGVLLAGTPVAARLRSPERVRRALVVVRVVAHLAIAIAGTSAAIDAFGRGPASLIAAGVLLLVSVTLVEGVARLAGVARVVGTGGAGASSTSGELLRGVFALGNTSVREIMVPRVNVDALDIDTPWSEVLDRVRSTGYARLPVYRDTLDNVVGILYAKDVLPVVVQGTEPGDWTSLIRPALFIPDSKSLDAQLREFQRQGSPIAMVVDEYGGIAGVVSIEDILEVIVGDIQDEYDEAEPDVRVEGSDRFWVAGELSLTELSELLGVDLARDDVTTVGGLLYDAFGGVPEPGDSLEMHGFRVVVERVRRRRIARVYFERQHAEATG